MRVELIVEYLGYGYGGYQRQNNADTIQERLERAYHALTGEWVNMLAAGRTDAGVSALAQHVAFDTAASIPADRISYAMNTRLPADIRVVASRQVDDGFSARYGAQGKRYRYTVVNRPHASAVAHMTSWHVATSLDLSAMRDAAGCLVGEHDFSAFMAAGGQTKTTVRTVWSVDIAEADGVVTIDVAGNGFLYNMVRIMAGTLIEVGKGKRTVESVRQALLSGKRENAGQTAPAKGLMLVEVYYE